MNKNHALTTARNGLHRGLAGLLCLVLLLGLMPGLELAASAEETTESWATPYLNQLVGWGVMRGDIDGNLYPERNITRAEFVTMMNRAYGYDKVAGNPFTDVYTSDWYYDDIDIAYNVGYFNGTSPTTASPQGLLTREQAAVLLARNMMLQGVSGETLGFTDSRDLSDWSRGLVGAAAKTGVIGGYGDGSFRPQNSITRGEVAAMLARAVGSLISQPGSQNLGSVYGNLTINRSGVDLRNTAIVGNLYLTGGIGLGDVLLENVDVYGDIIVAGAGEANSSNSSVIMRNVTANGLTVDNISNQFVTVRAEGDTRIAKTSVRTNAYVEDTTPNGYGLSYIELDGEQGTKLQLAGNIKEVKNLTPMSSLEIVQGSASKVTSDEHATGSGVKIDGGARVDELNLDVGANVTGTGDIGTMNVGAAGTNVGILPDNITVRPGITSNITGTSMNNVTAAESSADPRLLSGYPAVRNVAPNSATLVFSANKSGTVYWAVSALADGSVSEDDLINNPSYGGGIFRSGKINAANSKTEYTAQVSGLTIDGAYYVSAILVDSRGNHSPLKVTAFSTPDNTTPAFTTGYPVITRNTTKTAQVTVMTNKSCQMYYALLPRGGSAPTANEFKSGSVSGNLGYGVVDVVKNNTQPVNVNSVPLEELTNYTLYLWLNDYDNARSSGVRSVQFTTPDETPPVVTDIMQTNSAAASVDVTYTLNEPGTLCWAVVAEGNDTFMNYDDLSSIEAKVKTEAGYGALKSGKSTASKADTAVRVAISGLNSKTYGTTSYDVYYIAKDKAGNYAASVGKINVRTLDTEAPTVSQEFTRFNDDKKDEPLADTDIRLVFSESVQGGTDGKNVFLTLYNAVKDAEDKSGPESKAAADAREALGTTLHRYIKLYPVPTPNNREVTVRDKENQGTADLNWTIDYRFATVDMEEGKMVITFPTKNADADPEDDPSNASALNLDSGATYYFRVEGIYDMALTPNPMGAQNLKEFTTVFARVQLSVGHTDNGIASVSNVPGWSAAAPAENPAGRIDFNFIVDPMSVDHADKNKLRDMLLWSNLELKYTIYAREVNDNYDPVDDGKWVRLNSEPISISTGGTTASRYSSFTQDVLHPDDDAPAFEKLNDPTWKKMEYAVHIDEIGNNKNFKEWNYNVTLRVSMVAGDGYPMRMLLDGGHDQESFDDAAANGVRSIGNPDPFRIIKTFSDKMPPDITDLTVKVTDTTAQINLMLNREGTVYYAAAPVLTLFGLNSTSALAKNDLTSVTRFSPSLAVTGGALYDDVPEKLDEDSEPIKVWGGNVQPELARIPMVTDGNTYKPASPTHVDIRDKTFPDGVIKNNTGRRGAHVSVSINLKDLNPNTVYLLFLTAEGVSGGYDTQVLCYRFTTEEAARPVIRLTPGTNAVNVQADKETNLSYKLALVGAEGTRLRMPFTGQSTFNGITAGTSSDNKTEWKINGDVLFTETKGTNGDSVQYQYTDEATHYTFTTEKPLNQMNVVDAMATLCYDNEQRHVGSLFDVYATQTAKSEYESNIKGNFDDNGTIVDRGTGKCSYSNSARTYTTDIQCKGMIADNPYAFVCVGTAPGDNSVSFAAYYTISQKDNMPPKIESIICTSLVSDEKCFTKDSQIIINFNEELWYRSNDNRWLPIDSCENTHRTGGNSGKYYTLGSLTVSPNGCELDYEKSSCGKEIQSLTFTVTKNASVIYIQIDGPICDSWGNVNSPAGSTSPQSIIITLSCNRTTGEVTLQNLSNVWKADGFTGVTTVG